MFYSLRRSVFSLTFVTCVFTAQAPLQANWPVYAEVATALLQGTCSKAEFDLKNDTSPEAQAKLAVVSVIRSVHDFLMLWNHPEAQDILEYGRKGLAFADSLNAVYRLEALIKDRYFNEMREKEQLNAEDQKLSEQVEFFRKNILPELQRVSAFALAFTNQFNNFTGVDRVDPRTFRCFRFAAMSIFSCSRLLETYLDLPDVSNAKKIVLVGLIIHAAESLYRGMQLARV